MQAQATHAHVCAQECAQARSAGPARSKAAAGCPHQQRRVVRADAEALAAAGAVHSHAVL